MCQMLREETRKAVMSLVPIIEREGVSVSGGNGASFHPTPLQHFHWGAQGWEGADSLTEEHVPSKGRVSAQEAPNSGIAGSG